MSKKLIAVASAAALALTALVGIAPASANTFGVAVVNASAIPSGQTAQSGDTAGTSFGILVPSGDVVRAGDAANGNNTTTTALRVTVTKSSSTATVTATATGGALLYNDTTLAANAATAGGAKTLSDATTGATSVFHVATTSTAASTVVFSDSNGNSKTIFIKGNSTWAYTMNFTATTATGISGEITMTGTVKDVFGNDLSTALVNTDFGISTLGGNLTGAAVADPTTANFAYNTTTKVYTIKATARDSAGVQAVSLVIDGANKASLKLAAFPAAVTSQFFSINVQDLAAAVTALNAQVAALKADYNALAERWNKRVASKKAPKKAVTLK
jgi:hypothetical protein